MSCSLLFGAFVHAAGCDKQTFTDACGGVPLPAIYEISVNREKNVMASSWIWANSERSLEVGNCHDSVLNRSRSSQQPGPGPVPFILCFYFLLLTRLLHDGNTIFFNIAI